MVLLRKDTFDKTFCQMFKKLVEEGWIVGCCLVTVGFGCGYVYLPVARLLGPRSSHQLLGARYQLLLCSVSVQV